MKQYIAVILIGILFITTLPYPSIEASNPCGYNVALDGPVPSGVSPCSVHNNLKFNSAMYYSVWPYHNGSALASHASGRQLIVYGNPTSVPSNYFAAGWQSNSTPSVYVEHAGHYRQNGGIGPGSGSGVWGEWRFHGYDASGEPYTNMFFRNDANTSTKNDQKRWVRHPWNTLPNDYVYKPQNPGEVWGNDESNLDHPSFQGIATNINRSLGFVIDQGITNVNNINSFHPYIDQSHHFLYASQAPTTREAGSGRMYHVSVNSGKLFYQSFALAQMTRDEKLLTPVEAQAEALDEPIPILDEETVKAHVMVTGTLKDEAFTDPFEKALYFTRADVKSWTLSIPAFNLTKTSTHNEVTVRGNQATTQFEIDVPVAQIDPITWRFTTQAVAAATFHGGSDPQQDDQGLGQGSDPQHQQNVVNVHIQFSPNDLKGGNLRSQFNSHSSFTFNALNELSSAMLNYRDASAGKTVNHYEIRITEGGSTQTFTHHNTVATLNSTTVNQQLTHWMINHFPYEPDLIPGTSKTRTYNLVQTLYTSDNATDSFSRTFTLTQSNDDPPPIFVDPQATFPDRWYDVVSFPASDATQDYVDRSCTVSGLSVNANELFSGNYIFGIGQHGLHHIECRWTSEDGSESIQTAWTVIYDTKPRVQVEFDGLFKENRTLTIQNDSQRANDPFVYIPYPNTYTFQVYELTGDSSDLRFRTNTTMQKVLMSQKPAIYELSLSATNSLGRGSDPHLVQFEIMPDEKPAVVIHPFDAEVIRGEEVRLHFSIESIDGDQIAETWLKLMYDSNNDGTFDQLIQTFSNEMIQSITVPNQLGQYKLEAYALESTTQPQLTEFLDGTENKSKISEGFFAVDNLKPMSDLYLDVTLDRPEVDVFFMLDSNLNQTKTNYVKGNRVTLLNQLIDLNINPLVEIWDMRTYTYSQPASTSIYTGTSYPASSTSYSSGSYSGTLSLSSTTSTQHSVDNGSYQTTTVYKTLTNSCENSPTQQWINGVAQPVQNSNTCGDTMYTTDDGYSGNIPRTSTVNTVAYWCTPSAGSPNRTCGSTWVAYYSGQGSKQVTNWVPNISYYYTYTGHYSGTIYQYVRQSYDNTFFRLHSDKYIVYLSDNTVSQTSDFTMVQNNHDADLILAGQNHITHGRTYEHFILNSGQDIQHMLNSSLEYIEQSSPPTQKYIKLVNEPVTTFTATVDFENDPLTTDQMMVLHDPGYFDNTEGFMDSYSNSKETSQWTHYEGTQTFTKPGMYTKIRKIMDLPTTDPRFSHYAYWSNESKLQIVVHRKPIADVTLEWDFDPYQNNYQTTWIDQSYDLDHSVTRAETDRGIVDRALSLFNHNSGVTLHTIPDRLQAGTYTLHYAAKDLEGAWSDPFTQTFTLSSAPPIQLRASVRTELPEFALDSIPASEQLRLYEIWTRYPYAHSLSVALFQGNLQRTTALNVPYYSGTKTANDIDWNDIVYTIPATTPDGSYHLRLTAIGQGGQQNFIEFPVTVNTPINLVPDFPAMLVVGQTYPLLATTSKYASTTAAILFHGTAYQTQQALISTIQNDQKNWLRDYTVPSRPDGNYLVQFLSTTGNGNVETITLPFTLTSNQPPMAAFDWLPKPVWEGDQVTLINQSSDPDGDPLTYEWKLTAPDGTIDTWTTIHGSKTLDQIGIYQVELTVSDGKATTSITQPLLANELLIEAEVNHTPLWLLHHVREGHETVTAPKDFYTGELFMLQLQSSNANISQVNAWLNTHGRAGNTIHIQTELTSQSNPNPSPNPDSPNLSNSGTTPITTTPVLFTGELYDSILSSLTNGLPLGVEEIYFQVEYANGVIKQVMVPIRILGHVQEVTGVRRRH